MTFNGDGRADLAAGISQKRVASADTGAAHVLYGSAACLSAEGNQLWHQGIPGMVDDAEADDFGAARWPRATSTPTGTQT